MYSIRHGPNIFNFLWQTAKIRSAPVAKKLVTFYQFAGWLSNFSLQYIYSQIKNNILSILYQNSWHPTFVILILSRIAKGVTIQEHWPDSRRPGHPSTNCTILHNKTVLEWIALSEPTPVNDSKQNVPNPLISTATESIEKCQVKNVNKGKNH